MDSSPAQTARDERQRREMFIEALRREAGRSFPEWTNDAGGDPGVTLLALSAWLAEGLIEHRTSIVRGQALQWLERLVRAASQLAADCAPSTSRIERVNFFAGQALTAEDFKAEQSYFRARLRRLNQARFGTGVVHGLEVAAHQSEGQAAVVVQPGLAIDPQGEELELSEETMQTLPAGDARSFFVLLRFKETAGADGSAVGTSLQPSRIIECCELLVSETEDPCALTLAVARRRRGRIEVVKSGRRASERRAAQERGVV